MRVYDQRASVSSVAAARRVPWRRTAIEAALGMMLASFGSGCGGSADSPGGVGPTSASGSNGTTMIADETSGSGTNAEAQPGLTDDTLPFMDDAAETDVEKLPVEFEQLVMTSFGGFQTASPPGAVCDAFSYSNRFQLDTASRTLTWDWCTARPTSALLQGSRVLTDAAFLNVTSIYSRASLTRGECGSDEPFGLLDVRSEVGVQNYAVSTSACITAFSNMLYVDWVSFFDLLSAFRQLSR